MTFKELYNKLSRDIAFSGPLVLRSKYEMTCATIGYILNQDYSMVRIKPNQVVVVLKTPAPAGGHKTKTGKYFVLLVDGQIAYWEPYHADQYVNIFETL